MMSFIVASCVLLLALLAGISLAEEADTGARRLPPMHGGGPHWPTPGIAFRSSG
jgi:hypothetical protein